MVSAKKLIQGSVIYMKKMRVSKRGFTLTEIIVVVAIIVIVASAAFVGVAVTLENAKKKRKDLNETHGRDPTGKELFEAGAWDEIDQWTIDAAQFFGIHYYTPSDGSDSGSTNTSDSTNTSATPVNDNTDDNVESEEERLARESAEASASESIAESIRASESIAESIRVSESIAESERLEKEKDKQQGGGSVTNTVNQQMQKGGSFYATADANKTIKSITVNWEKTSQASGSFIISYEDSNGGNFNNASQGVQTGWDQYSGSETFTPQANGRSVSCAKLKFSNPWSTTDVKIVSYTIVYED